MDMRELPEKNHVYPTQDKQSKEWKISMFDQWFQPKLMLSEMSNKMTTVE